VARDDVLKDNSPLTETCPIAKDFFSRRLIGGTGKRGQMSLSEGYQFTHLGPFACDCAGGLARESRSISENEILSATVGEG